MHFVCNITDRSLIFNIVFSVIINYLLPKTFCYFSTILITSVARDVYVGIVSSDCGRRSRHGCDRVFAVNYLGHFLLVNQLLPLLVHSAPSRIVSVTSVAHMFIRDLVLDQDSQKVEGHSRFCRKLAGYDTSKLAMVLHVKELSRRLGGLPVSDFSLFYLYYKLVLVNPALPQRDVIRTNSVVVY